MTNARVIGVRSVELGVRDLTQSAAFYRNVWGLDEVESVRTLSGHKGPVWSVSFRSDGKQVLTASADRSIRIWDPASQAALKVLTETSQSGFAGT